MDGLQGPIFGVLFKGLFKGAPNSLRGFYVSTCGPWWFHPTVSREASVYFWVEIRSDVFFWLQMEAKLVK